jgi:hypothetical protein
MTEIAPDIAPLPPIYTRIEQSPTATDLIDGAIQLSSYASRFEVIESAEQAAVAGEYLARNRKHVKLLDEERLEMTRGARETIERINVKFHDKIDELRGKDKIVASALTTWMQKKEAEARAVREAELRAQREAAEAAEAARTPPTDYPPPPAPLAAPARTIHGSHGSTVTFRDNWKWRITDIALVPETYLVPPEQRIQRPMMNAAVKAKAKAALAAFPPGERPGILRVRDLPGIELYNEPVPSTSTF